MKNGKGFIGLSSGGCKARPVGGFFALVLLASGFLFAGNFISCKNKDQAGQPNPELVSAFSSGVIDRNGPVVLEFTREFDTSKPIPQNAFRLEPSAKGTLSWRNSFTLEFLPSKPLKPGKVYTATVDPSVFVPQGEVVRADAFSFSFETSVPVIGVSLEPVRIDENENVLVSGYVLAEKGADPSRVEKTIRAPELGKISWVHDGDEHRFSFSGLSREAEPRTLVLSWDGKPLGVDDKGFLSVLVPGLQGFEVVEIKYVDGMLVVTFSSPLKSNQDLRGFVSLSGKTDIRYSLDGNIVRIYGEREGGGSIPEGAVLSIQDLADANGNVLAEPVQFTVSGKWELPEVRFAGRGTVLPSSQGSQMVVETRNLSGVLVEAFRIYGDNMVQFLQVNSMESSEELDRVGEPVWVKAFDLPWKVSDKNVWRRQGLDLSELARKYPDDMFHIRLSFRPRHVKYEEEGAADFSSMRFPDDSFPPFGNRGESSYWDWADDYDYYTWRNNHLNPYHPAFYRAYYDHNITIGKNVLISDLALIAKRGLDGSWVVAASNVKTAKSESGVALEVLNYQGRVLYRLKTDGSGMAVFGGVVQETAGGIPPGNQTPAFIYASGGAGRAYLKIADGQALTVSHFDISGGQPAAGLRGLLYGERGVWRPGDDMYLTFLLSDPAKTLPANHPVSFELEDPRGRIRNERTFTSSMDGFYPISVSTQPDAPTGNWTARVKVGGSVFSRTLKVETVIPNRLRVDLDFGPKNYIERQTPVNFEAAWLYGASAPGLRADISVSFSERQGGFSANSDYSFSDLSRSVSGERQTVWEGTLDNAGKAAFTMDLDPGASVPGKLNARFMTRVFEPSGAFSSEQITKEFSPYKRYVGLRLPKGDAARNMLLTDVDHRADILVLDADGKPVNGSVTLECAVYKLNWRWWWEKGEYEEAEFASVQSRSPITRGTVTAQNGKAAWNFQVKFPEWGRYMVLVRDTSGGHAAANVVYIDWPGWAGRATEGSGQGAAAMLVLSPDKQQYSAGEKVSISFPSNKNASALVVLEKGGKVLKKEWVQCDGEVTRYEFTSDVSMVPNVYAHVTLLQPHLQTQNDLPIRLYGITPVMVDDPRTKLVPVVTVSDNWEPESEVNFTVSESSGRPMTYTVAVVDEGLLGLTRYSLPNPLGIFYAREASFLKSWDLYSDFMSAYSGQLETLLVVGGSDDGSADGGKETQRFKPVVRYFGPFEIKAGEKKTEQFTLPPYIGALRVMVMAASSTSENRGNRAYGTAEKQVTVSSDLMVFGTIPRTLSPGDEAVIPVSVASYKSGIRNVQVEMNVTGAALQGQKTVAVSFDKTGEKTVQFRIRAPNLPGTARFSISASSAGVKTARQTTDLEIRSTAVPVTNTILKLLSPGESWNGTIAYPGLAGSNTANAEFSRLPPLDLEKRLDYLVRYPHGCIEQTTSAAFPQLYLDKVLDLNPQRLNEIRGNVRAAIERLAGFQVPGGGFSYWPGGESADDWGSTYAGHFLIEAKRAGYLVPSDMLSGFISFQKGRAAGWASREGNMVEQAYRLYTLALAGEADLGSMNRLRERQGLDQMTRWRLAAAYWYAGQRDTSRRLVSGQDTRVADYREYGGTFGSAFRDRMVLLETLILLGGETADTKALFEEAADTLSKDGWLSTQETAVALKAAMLFMQGAASQQDREMNVDLVMAGTNKSIVFTSQVQQTPLGNPSGTSGAFTVRNRSSVPVYARISVRGLPEEGKEQALARGLALSVEYRDVSGAIVNPAAVNTGDDIEVTVRVSNTRRVDLENIALVHQLPASWEILNDRIGGTSSSSSSSFAYQDIRDDRIMTYFDLPSGAVKVIRFKVNKTYGGSYFRPAIHAYAMYDESVAALIPGTR
ncbi:MAG: alpha-2-macroglobulin [Treponema sp.]|jgi:uncharacterized protein YfaS (alpha-2-macroglobulin family)|nr:alpha-2-macroglobulin [Treponema sp.]